MQEIFYGQDYQDESLVSNKSKNQFKSKDLVVSNKSNKQFKSKDLELQHLVKSIENIKTEYKPFNSNISKDEQEALQKLITNKDIIIKPRDKGGGLVLMDKTYYRDHLVNKEHLHSKVYKEVPLDSDKKVYKQLPLLVEKYKSNLTSKEIKYLTGFKWQSSNIYCTPKTHKCKSTFIYRYIDIYNLHFFEQKIYIHQVLIYLIVAGIPVRKPLQNKQIVEEQLDA